MSGRICSPHFDATANSEGSASRNPLCRITNGASGGLNLLELLRIVEALKGDPRRVFADILNDEAEPRIEALQAGWFGAPIYMLPTTDLVEGSDGHDR